MITTLRFRRLAVGAAAVGLLLTGCSSESTSSGGETDNPVESGTETNEGGETAPEGGETATAAAGEACGTLRFGYFEPSTSMDPHTGTSSQDMPWLLPVYDRILHYESDGSIVPGLAEDWELTDDALTLTMREGVTFHDGTPLNAEAVVANLDRARTLETSAVAEQIGSVESVEAVDDMTVKLSLSQPDSALPSVLADRAGMLVSPQALEDGTDLNLEPVGAGPFQAAEYVPGQRLDLERYDDYWNPESVLLDGGVISYFGDDDTRLNALRAGEVDIAELSAAQVESADADPALTVRNDPSLGVTHIALNIAIEPLDDVLVRQAINHAVNREAIREAIFFGQGRLAWQPFPPGYYAHSPEAEQLYPYDPDRARELLAEAGYPDGFDLKFPTNTQSIRVAASEALQSMLAEVGINLTIEPMEGPALLDRFYYEKDIAAYYSPWGGRVDPAMTLENMFGPDGLNNPSGQTAPELVELLDQGRSTYDSDERGDIYAEFSRVLMEEEARMIPLVFPGTTVAHRDTVQYPGTGISGKLEFKNVSVDCG